MSRSTNNILEWERQKWYLVRSLFDNEPLLSPIPEAQEQSSPAEAARSRSHSPLPDLTIEKEPNRHDEPEEYYQELEKRIKKVYKRLFVKTRPSEDSSIEDIHELLLSLHTEETRQSDQSSIERKQSSDERCFPEETKVIDEQITESTNTSSDNRSETKDSIMSSDEHSRGNTRADSFSNEHLALNELSDPSPADQSESNSYCSVESSTFVEPNEELKLSDKRKSTSSSEKTDTSSMNTSDFKIIVTKAQIHDGERLRETGSHVAASAVDKVTSASNESVIHDTSDKRDQSKSTVTIPECKDTEVSDAQNTQSEAGLESLPSSVTREEIMELAFSGVSADDSSVDEPEAMRRQDTINTSLQSPNAFNVRRHSSIGIELLEHSAREMEEAEESADLSINLAASTPQFTSQEMYNKRKVLSELSNSGPSKRSKQNLTTQTSFSTTDDENDWSEIRTNFFVGSPCIYKLCTCSNHVCR